MDENTKQTFLVVYSIVSNYDIDVKANNVEEAIRLADATFDKDGKWTEKAPFTVDIEVLDEDEEVVLESEYLKF